MGRTPLGQGLGALAPASRRASRSGRVSRTFRRPGLSDVLCFRCRCDVNEPRTAKLQSWHQAKQPFVVRRTEKAPRSESILEIRRESDQLVSWLVGWLIDWLID